MLPSSDGQSRSGSPEEISQNSTPAGEHPAAQGRRPGGWVSGLLTIAVVAAASLIATHLHRHVHAAAGAPIQTAGMPWVSGVVAVGPATSAARTASAAPLTATASAAPLTVMASAAPLTPTASAAPLTVTAASLAFTLPGSWVIARPLRTVDLAEIGQPISGTNSFFTATSPDGSQQFSVTVSVGEIGVSGNQATPPNADQAVLLTMGAIGGKISSWVGVTGEHDLQLDAQISAQEHLTVDATGVTAAEVGRIVSDALVK